MIIAHIFSFVCIDMEANASGSSLKASVSAWLGVFGSNAMSSAESASVIVFAGYLLLLFFFSSKPFSLILSIEVLST